VVIGAGRATYNSYRRGVNASWEIDIWGRIRRQTEAARAQLLASEEGRRGVILSLVGSVAGAYINLRDLDRQLEIARATAKSPRRVVRDLQAPLTRVASSRCSN
jgi:multidrug efflux system outer membrane protein